MESPKVQKVSHWLSKSSPPRHHCSNHAKLFSLHHDVDFVDEADETKNGRVKVEVRKLQ